MEVKYSAVIKNGNGMLCWTHAWRNFVNYPPRINGQLYQYEEYFGITYKNDDMLNVFFATQEQFVEFMLRFG